MKKEFDLQFMKENMMGPNAVTLLYETIEGLTLLPGMRVMDLGCGTGLTSMCLAESGATVFAVDLWITATENDRRFKQVSPGRDIIPIHADATDLPFADEFFDAVVSVDSYHYFGRDAKYMDEKLAPLVKKGGVIAICVPGLKHELNGELPEEIKKSWSAKDMETMHSCEWWHGLLSESKLVDVLEVRETRSFETCWEDWLQCDNPYAIGDRAAMRAGAGKYLNFVLMICRRK